ncbi:MAG: nucleotidyltransferase family protein [Candidatus Rokubacteria bacterium]|nr:nucleotidyltransferase family protein [Candidatus Rokubacteria bacterium]
MIAGIVLAAGLSLRMGRAKLLLDWGGKPVVRRVVEQVKAGGVDEVVVVLGREAQGIREALCGVAARGPGVSAALIALGDQPALPPEVIPRLLQTFRETAKAIVAPLYRGVQGNPVLFAAAVFPELRALTGDRGARSVVEKDPPRVALVSFDLPMPADLDTFEDYERLRPRVNPV